MSLIHYIYEDTFQVSQHKCLFWEEEKTIILSDVHIGKTSHFRKNGIGISVDLINAELVNLKNCISIFNPQKIIIVGDLFHSHINKEVELFGNWIKQFHQIEWHLVKGNHDILEEKVYHQLGMTAHHQLQIKKIVFTHELPEKLEDAFYYITGHVHPAINVAIGKTKQKRFPCFLFSEQHAIVPSFGLFTGSYTIKPLKKDVVFAITPTSIIKI